MDRNKRTARTLTAALCLALLAGCGAETAGESLDADEMHPGWSTVTTDPSAYGITYQELEDLSGMPLDQLTAYCLGLTDTCPELEQFPLLTQVEPGVFRRELTADTSDETADAWPGAVAA